MALALGIDTGGTYTDAVLMDEQGERLIAQAKRLTTRPDLALGVAAVMDAVLAGQAAGQVGLVALSTTLATNALVEGQGGRAALVAIGFDEGDLGRDDLPQALAGDPLILLAGGHSHAGAEVAPLDLAALAQALDGLPAGLAGVAVAARFATRNPAHERAARALIRDRTGLPVTCSHELSAALGGPRRALTALLNARLVGLIARLIDAVEGHMAARGITAPLMVVRGDGALIPAASAREKPIETILSGPAASIAGASWLTGIRDALVSDIGGTTTDICLLRDGRPAIDPEGARVGPFRTMVEAVAMRTTGLGGDSEVHVEPGLAGALRLGPRRLMPLSLIARDHPEVVHAALAADLRAETPQETAGRFLLPLFTALPEGLDPREAAVAGRLLDGPLPKVAALRSRLEGAALSRLIARGLVMEAGVTPSDAAHVLGLLADWDGAAAAAGLTLLARRRSGRGERLAPDARAIAEQILQALRAQTVDCLLEAAFAEAGWSDPAALARHPLTRGALGAEGGLLRMTLGLGVPVIGLGASAGSYYPPLGPILRTQVVLPPEAGVANAIGAVTGQVAMHVEGTVTSPAPGAFVAHLPGGPVRLGDQDAAMAALEAALTAEALARAEAAGVPAPRLTTRRELRSADVEGNPMFIEARLRVTAQGRPRIAAAPLAGSPEGR